MDCSEARARLAGGAKRDAGLDAHLASCEACRALADDGGALAGRLAGAASALALPVPDLALLEERVAAELQDERGPLAALRGSPRVVRFGLLAAAIALVAAFFHAFFLRIDYGQVPQARFWGFFAYDVGVALIAAWHALRPIWLPPAPRWVPWTIIGLGVLAPIVATLMPELATPAPFAAAEHQPHAAFYCLAVGSTSGMAIVLLARAIGRGGGRSMDEALLAAVAGGLAGLLGLHFECPINFRMHLLLGHVPVPIVLVLANRFLTRRA